MYPKKLNEDVFYAYLIQNSVGTITRYSQLLQGWSKQTFTYTDFETDEITSDEFFTKFTFNAHSVMSISYINYPIIQVDDNTFILFNKNSGYPEGFYSIRLTREA